MLFADPNFPFTPRVLFLRLKNVLQTSLNLLGPTMCDFYSKSTHAVGATQTNALSPCLKNTLCFIRPGISQLQKVKNVAWTQLQPSVLGAASFIPFYSISFLFPADPETPVSLRMT